MWLLGKLGVGECKVVLTVVIVSSATGSVAVATVGGWRRLFILTKTHTNNKGSL